MPGLRLYSRLLPHAVLSVFSALIVLPLLRLLRVALTDISLGRVRQVLSQDTRGVHFCTNLAGAPERDQFATSLIARVLSKSPDTVDKPGSALRGERHAILSESCEPWPHTKARQPALTRDPAGTWRRTR